MKRLSERSRETLHRCRPGSLPRLRPPLPSALVDYRKIITVEPGKRSGKPCIRGMCITVYDVLGYLAGGMTEEEVLADFPELTRDDIAACRAFGVETDRRVAEIAATGEAGKVAGTAKKLLGRGRRFLNAEESPVGMLVAERTRESSP